MLLPSGQMHVFCESAATGSFKDISTNLCRFKPHKCLCDLIKAIGGRCHARSEPKDLEIGIVPDVTAKELIRILCASPSDVPILELMSLSLKVSDESIRGDSLDFGIPEGVGFKGSMERNVRGCSRLTKTL